MPTCAKPNKTASPATKTVLVRMPQGLVAAVDAEVKIQQAANPGTKVSRSSVIRELIRRTFTG